MTKNIIFALLLFFWKKTWKKDFFFFWRCILQYFFCFFLFKKISLKWWSFSLTYCYSFVFCFLSLVRDLPKSFAFLSYENPPQSRTKKHSPDFLPPHHHRPHGHHSSLNGTWLLEKTSHHDRDEESWLTSQVYDTHTCCENRRVSRKKRESDKKERCEMKESRKE